MRQAETAIENSFLYEEAVRLSLTDGLTGLWNRRHFDLRLEAELSRAVRFSEPFAVVFVDLDQFKAVNDRHGHQAGDTVLVELARRLTEAVREVDLVARWGGDEFALLLPKTGLAGALRLAEKIRAGRSRDAPFRIDSRPVDSTSPSRWAWPPIPSTALAARSWWRRPTAPCTGPRRRAATGWSMPRSGTGTNREVT